ncbi:MAG: hypothetical protein ABIP93_20540 [Gemmatimonadaceae bacterium]
MIAASAHIERVLDAIFPPPAWMVEALTARRRALSLSVADWEELFVVSAVRGAPFYNEVVQPHHLMAPLMMLAETGEASLPRQSRCTSTTSGRRESALIGASSCSGCFSPPSAPVWTSFYPSGATPRH